MKRHFQEAKECPRMLCYLDYYIMILILYIDDYYIDDITIIIIVQEILVNSIR